MQLLRCYCCCCILLFNEKLKEIQEDYCGGKHEFSFSKQQQQNQQKRRCRKKIVIQPVLQPCKKFNKHLRNLSAKKKKEKQQKNTQERKTVNVRNSLQIIKNYKLK